LRQLPRQARADWEAFSDARTRRSPEGVPGREQLTDGEGDPERGRQIASGSFFSIEKGKRRAYWRT
jgi:hypothetical protein